jgi:hypothetical protein
MSIFSRHKKLSRPPQTFKPARIEFIGEQSGTVEDELKGKFRELFAKTPTVLCAYLARLSYGDPAGYSVALCIRSTAGVDQPLQKRLAQLFTDMFRRDQYLDTLFIRDDQEQELKKVCRPFYETI